MMNNGGFLMKMIRLIAGLLLVVAVLALPQTVRACPLCADAIANSNQGEADDIDDFPAAMNQSIYLMLGVPYFAFGVVGLMIHRGVLRNEAYARAVSQKAADAGSAS
jgi:hypothetical protein